MNHSKTGSSPSSSSSSSSTRLSASAKPFTLKRSISGFHCPEPAIYSPDHTISDPFSSLLDSFPKFNLGAKLTSLASSFPNDAASQFQTQTQEESLPRFASVGLKGNDDYVVINGSDFDLHKDLSLPLYSSDFTGVGLGAFDGSELNYGKRGKDCHESLFSKGNDNGRSAAHGSVLQKGKRAVDGLNLCHEASDGIFYDGDDSVLAKDILLNSRGKMDGGVISSSVLASNCEDTSFIFSTSDKSSAAKLNNTSHNQGRYAPSVVTYSDLLSTGVSSGQYVSELPFVRNVASDPIGKIPVVIHGSKSACTVLFPFDSSSTMTGNCGAIIDDKDNSSSTMSGTKDAFLVLNTDGKGNDDGNKEKICKSISSDAMDYSTNTTNEVTLKSDGTGDGFLIKTSSKVLGDSDSDLDSPCWKGTMKFAQSSLEILEPEKRNSLNPLAPLFFPSNAEGSSCLGGKNVKDDFVSSKSRVPLAVDLLPEEDRQMKTVIIETHPTEFKEVDPRCSFLLNSKPFSVEDCSTMKRTTVTTMDVEGCVKETKNSMARGSTRGTFTAKCQSLTHSSSSTQVGVVNDLCKTLKGVSKSLIDSPKLDIQIMVNAMHVLSELLVQTHTYGLDSYKEHDHDTVQRIINNLNVFSNSNSGQMILTLRPTHEDSHSFLGRSSEIPKHSREGVKVASINNIVISEKLHHQNDDGRQYCGSKVSAERGQNSSASRSDMGTEKGNDIVQVFRKNLSKVHDVDEHLPSQALLYKNLWLDSEATLCHMRRKIYLRLMESGIDVNCADFLDLWR